MEKVMSRLESQAPKLERELEKAIAENADKHRLVAREAVISARHFGIEVGNGTSVPKLINMIKHRQAIYGTFTKQELEGKRWPRGP
jgi:hypothetical protein